MSGIAHTQAKRAALFPYSSGTNSLARGKKFQEALAKHHNEAPPTNSDQTHSKTPIAPSPALFWGRTLEVSLEKKQKVKPGEQALSSSITEISEEVFKKQTKHVDRIFWFTYPSHLHTVLEGIESTEDKPMVYTLLDETKSGGKKHYYKITINHVVENFLRVFEKHQNLQKIRKEPLKQENVAQTSSSDITFP